MNSTTAFNSIVFDLDGTVFDTWPSLLEAAHQSICAHYDTQTAALNRPALRAALSQGLHAFYRTAVLSVDPVASPELVARLSVDMRERWRAFELPAPRVYAGLYRTLQVLTDQGVRLGVCTNRDRETSLELLCATGLDTCFTTVITCDDVPEPKPAPVALGIALQQMKADPSCTLFVGDSLVDALSARNAAVPFAAHLGGYAVQPEDLRGALFEFSSYHGFLTALQAHRASFVEVTHA